MCITEYDEAETLEILANEIRREERLIQQQETIRSMKEEGLPTQLIARIMKVTDKYVNTIS